MGLDGVELILAIEEEFKIVILNEEASSCVTVGKMVDLVHARLRHSVEDPCLSQHGFYVVRQALMAQFGLGRSGVKPDSELESLIPEADRRSEWKSFIRKLTGEEDVPPFALVRPRRLNRLVMFLLPAIAFGFTVVKVPHQLFWLGIFPALLVFYLGDRLTARWKTHFPRDYLQVRDLVPIVRTLDSRVWTKEEVFEKIRKISVEILGVKPEQVTMEARWVDDLGVD